MTQTYTQHMHVSILNSIQMTLGRQLPREDSPAACREESISKRENAYFCWWSIVLEVSRCKLRPAASGDLPDLTTVCGGCVGARCFEVKQFDFAKHFVADKRRGRVAVAVPREQRARGRRARARAHDLIYSSRARAWRSRRLACEDG